MYYQNHSPNIPYTIVYRITDVLSHRLEIGPLIEPLKGSYGMSGEFKKCVKRPRTMDVAPYSKRSRKETLLNPMEMGLIDGWISNITKYLCFSNTKCAIHGQNTKNPMVNPETKTPKKTKKPVRPPPPPKTFGDAIQQKQLYTIKTSLPEKDMHEKDAVDVKFWCGSYVNSGTYGDIFIPKGKPFALKQIMCEHGIKQKNGYGIRMNSDYIWELNIAQRLSHINGVGVPKFTLPLFNMNVMQRYTCDLRKFIRCDNLCSHDLSKHRNFSNVAIVKSIARNLFRTMRDVHRMGICHRDLKPENIMIQEEPDTSLSIKIIDWGLAGTPSTFLGDYGDFIEVCSSWYRAPELVYRWKHTPRKANKKTTFEKDKDKDDDKDDKETVDTKRDTTLRTKHTLLECAQDVYALGIIICEMLIGECPTNGMMTSEDVKTHFCSEMYGYRAENIVYKLYHDQEWNYPDESHPFSQIMRKWINNDIRFLDFLRKCLHPDPKKRYTADMLMRHPWITNDETAHWNKKMDQYWKNNSHMKAIVNIAKKQNDKAVKKKMYFPFKNLNSEFTTAIPIYQGKTDLQEKEESNHNKLSNSISPTSVVTLDSEKEEEKDGDSEKGNKKLVFHFKQNVKYSYDMKGLVQCLFDSLTHLSCIQPDKKKDRIKIKFYMSIWMVPPKKRSYNMICTLFILAIQSTVMYFESSKCIQFVLPIMLFDRDALNREWQLQKADMVRAGTSKALMELEYENLLREYALTTYSSKCAQVVKLLGTHCITFGTDESDCIGMIDHQLDYHHIDSEPYDKTCQVQHGLSNLMEKNDFNSLSDFVHDHVLPLDSEKHEFDGTQVCATLLERAIQSI